MKQPPSRITERCVWETWEATVKRMTKFVGCKVRSN